MERSKEIRSKISGVTHDDPYSGLNRQQIIKQFVRPGAELIPKLEPNNPRDSNAVALWFKRQTLLGHKWYHLGYLSGELARDIAPILREGNPIAITISEITGGTKAKPTRGMNIVLRYQK